MRPEVLIRGLDGLPQPPSDVLARIHQHAPRAGLLYTRAAWAITMQWDDDDARRAWIQQGHMQPSGAFDVVGYLPVTCSLEEAPALIARELREWPAAEYGALREAVAHWNDTGREDAVQDQVLAGVYNDMDKPRLDDELAQARAENERLRQTMARTAALAQPKAKAK